MRPEEYYLRDIIFACRLAKTFVQDITEDFFHTSDLYQSAVLYQLTIVGEAVSRLSGSVKSKYPEVDWFSISGFRNVIVHDYFSLNLEIVWHASNVDVLELVTHVSNILQQEYPYFAKSNNLEEWRS